MLLCPQLMPIGADKLWLLILSLKLHPIRAAQMLKLKLTQTNWWCIWKTIIISSCLIYPTTHWHYLGYYEGFRGVFVVDILYLWSVSNTAYIQVWVALMINSYSYKNLIYFSFYMIIISVEGFHFCLKMFVLFLSIFWRVRQFQI